MTSKLRVNDICEGNSPETGEFPAQTSSDTENVSIWWRHHDSRIHKICWKGMARMTDMYLKICPQI